MTPTREQGTEIRYRRIATARLRRFKEETGLDWDTHIEAFLTWMESERNKLSPASWRQIRAAMSWLLKETGYPDLGEAVSEITTEGCPKATATSSKKLKRLPEKDKEALSDELMASHRKHLRNGGELVDSVALKTLFMLLAGEITGMRPSEWWETRIWEPDSEGGLTEWTPEYMDALMSDTGIRDAQPLDKLVVQIKNGKRSNGRAHGETRTLKLKGIQKETAVALLGHFWFVKQNSTREQYDVYQKSCTDRMSYATKKLWPNRKKKPSLYSARHQFSANLKLCKTLKEIAALMGHGTDRTASEHYGRRANGRSLSVNIEANADEVSRIKGTYKGAPSPESNSPTIGKHS